MANALALAAVTAVLQNRLTEGLLSASLDVLGQLRVTTLPPDRLEDGPATNRLNLYLWHASRNVALANQRLPARSASGERLDNPWLALDLHYILTATGADELNAEILLGHGMQLLHETPVLTKAEIGTALGGGSAPLSAAQQLLAAADIADQIEQIRLTPVNADSRDPARLEALGNIWSAFSTPLRASALYQAACILIESRHPARPALPVLSLGGHTAPLRRPRIDAITALAGGAGGRLAPATPITAGSWVALTGTALLASPMRLMLGTRELAPAAATDQRLDVQLPADQLAGVGRFQIDHLFVPGPGSAPRLWESSNAAAIFITPEILTTRLSGHAAAGRFDGDIEVTLAHPLGAGQKVMLLLNPRPGVAAPALAVPATITDPAGGGLRATVAGVVAAGHVVRVEVDGAASVPTLGPQGFDSPAVDFGA